MHRLPIPVRYQHLQTLFRAFEIVIWLGRCELDVAINVARAALVAEKSRRQYLHEILPSSVAYAMPGKTQTFVVECSDGLCFRLRNSTLPLLWQILTLEREQNIQVVRVIHDDGCRQWTYCL